MNKGRFVGGIICLALAALLGVLNLTLPADDLMFTVGEENMPWVPVAILGIVGLVLLVTAGAAGKRPGPQVARAGNRHRSGKGRPEQAPGDHRLGLFPDHAGRVHARAPHGHRQGILVHRRRRHHAGTERGALLQRHQDERLYHLPGRDLADRRHPAVDWGWKPSRAPSCSSSWAWPCSSSPGSTSGSSLARPRKPDLGSVAQASLWIGLA